MSRKDDHRMGVTPIVLRRAAYYLTLGEGVYLPEHPHYNKVVVQKLYEFMANPMNDAEWGLGMVVSFYQDARVVRWVEFGCRTTGAGGDDIVKKAET